MPRTAILDVDGTLVDSNYQHALAWFRAFRRYGITLEMWRVHRHIGMGGDQLVPALVGEEVDAAMGDQLREQSGVEFEPLIGEVAAFDRAHELLVELKRRGFTVVLASSGKPADVEHWLDVLDARDHCDAWTTSQDVGETKPAPDLLQVALDRVGADEAVVLGDSVWDFEAARRLGLASIGLRTGGFGVEELRQAGADLVLNSVADLVEALDSTPFHSPDA